MSNSDFLSVLASRLDEFLALRHAGGRDAKSQRALLRTLDRFLHQQHFNTPWLTREVVEDYLRWAEIKKEDRDSLTHREREILQLVAEGYTNQGIADILHISIKTVKSHRSNLMQKLDLHNRGDLIKYAIQKKIIDI